MRSGRGWAAKPIEGRPQCAHIQEIVQYKHFLNKLEFDEIKMRMGRFKGVGRSDINFLVKARKGIGSYGCMHVRPSLFYECIFANGGKLIKF